MNLGMFLMPLAMPGQSLGETMDELTRKARFLEETGFDEFWLGEHFAATSEPVPSPLAFLSSLVPQTKRLTFGTGVISLPNRHPAVIAAEVAQIDHLSKGRFRFGIGTGSLPPDWELFKLEDEDTRKRMMLESINIIQKIWRSGPPYEFNGEFWKFGVAKSVDAELRMGFMPTPREPAGPPIHVSIATPMSSTSALAGERGWGPLSSSLLMTDGIARHWAGYSKGLAKAGRPVNGDNWRVVRVALVAPSDAEAERRLHHAEGAVSFYFRYIHKVLANAGKLAAMKTRPDMADSEVDVAAAMSARVIRGSAKSVRDQLIDLRDKAGPFEHLLIAGMPWNGVNEEWERESLTLLAREVMPAVRAHYSAPAKHAAQ